MSDAFGAAIFVATFITIMETFFVTARIWRERPAVGLDPNTGHYRSVRRMAAERQR